MERRKTLILLFLLAFSVCGTAQQIRLLGTPQRQALYFNADHLWTYTLYEQSSWGAGLRFVARRPQSLITQYDADLYAAFAHRTQQWKGALSLALHLPLADSSGRISFSVRRDCFPVAQRLLTSPSITDVSSQVCLMSRRMVERTELSFGFGRRIRGASVSVGGTLFRQYRLFSADALLYRSLGDTLTAEEGIEWQLRVDHPRGITIFLQYGSLPSLSRSFLRAETQYAQSFPFGRLCAELFLQAGYSTRGTPYTHLFDLGGTFGVPLLFSHSLLTLRPNEFAASEFLFAEGRLRTAKPLFNLYNKLFYVGTRPTPFVGINVAWGRLHGQRPDGSLLYEGLLLQSPSGGLLEALLGIDGLLRWGLVDWGVAVASRLDAGSLRLLSLPSGRKVSFLLSASLSL